MVAHLVSYSGSWILTWLDLTLKFSNDSAEDVAWSCSGGADIPGGPREDLGSWKMPL